MTKLVVMFGFDGTTDAALRAVWQRLADAGLHHAVEPRHRPHLSAAVVEVDTPDLLIGAAADTCASVRGCDVAWSGVGVFPPARDRGTVFAAPVVTSALLDLHAEVHRRLVTADFDLTDDHPFLLPGHWTPHSTLHTDLAPDDIDLTVRAALPAFPLPTGRVDRLVIAPKARESELWSGHLLLA